MISPDLVELAEHPQFVTLVTGYGILQNHTAIDLQLTHQKVFITIKIIMYFRMASIR